MTEYTVTRAERKTAAIYVHEDGSVEVRCPQNFPAREIEKFVLQNLKTLEKKIAQTKARVLEKEAFFIEPGGKLRFLGVDYPLEQVTVAKIGFDGSRFYIPYEMDAEEIKSSIVEVYKRLAEKWLNRKTQEYAKIMSLNPVHVKVNSAKTRWGSCSGKNSINYSWRLIMADERCVDYVVIHELAHIAEHNHSKKFWAIVEKYMPDYKAQEKGLKEIQKKLAAENWD